MCTTCSKSYLRETHLQAHARSHLPDSVRPFECPEEGCSKRFWTVQHLKVHESTHKGEKPWKVVPDSHLSNWYRLTYVQCTEADCLQSFTKHHHLSAHISAVHSPAGTKPYQCEHPDCSSSFTTNQKLWAHQKTHDEKRYSCSHPSCLSLPTMSFFSTWTKLQAHMRTVHPPTCPHPECHGKTFSQQKGLKAHLKIHDGRDLNDRLDDGEGAGDGDEPAVKRKRGGDHGRDWVCDFEGCAKDFKSVFPSSKASCPPAHDHGSNRRRLLQHTTTSHTSINAISSAPAESVASPTVTSTFSNGISHKRIVRWNCPIVLVIWRKTTREVPRWTSTELPADLTWRETPRSRGYCVVLIPLFPHRSHLIGIRSYRS